MLTAVTRRRWVIGHGLRLDFMTCCQSIEYQTAIARVTSLAIDQGIQQGLEVGIEHGKSGESWGCLRCMTLRPKRSSPSDEDETPEFCRLQPMLEQKYKKGASSSLVVVETIVSIRMTALWFPYVAIVDGTVSTAEPHDDLFDTTVLDKPVAP
ncbi:hypothetical protein Tco_0778285 [Tanacetum coccineum]